MSHALLSRTALKSALTKANKRIAEAIAERDRLADGLTEVIGERNKMAEGMADAIEERDRWKKMWSEERDKNKKLTDELAAHRLAADHAREMVGTVKRSLHGMEVRAHRAEAIAEQLHAQLFPQPTLPWQAKVRGSYQHVGDVGEFNFEQM